MEKARLCALELGPMMFTTSMRDCPARGDTPKNACLDCGVVHTLDDEGRLQCTLKPITHDIRRSVSSSLGMALPPKRNAEPSRAGRSSGKYTNNER